MRDEESRSGFTRRVLVREAVAGVVAAKVGGKTPQAAYRTLGPQAVPVELTINGKNQILSKQNGFRVGLARVTLERALREVLA